MRRVTRLLRYLLPAPWRETVAADLEEEASGAHGQTWVAARTVSTGVRLRWATTGDVLTSDVRYALRSLVRARWFTLGAVLTFALGIGANVAVLAIVDRMLFRPLPFTEPDRLVQAHRSEQTSRFVLDLAITTRWRREAQTVEDVAYADGGTRTLVVEELGGAPISVSRVTFNLLSVLGVRPIAGRDFTIEDARAERRRIMLSDAAWQFWFNRDPGAIGRVLRTDDFDVEVVGVLPPDFLLPSSALMERLDAIDVSPDVMDRPNADGWVSTAPVARLRPGTTPEAASAELTAIASRLSPADLPMIHASLERNPSFTVVPLQSGMTLKYRAYLRLIVAGVADVAVLAGRTLDAADVSATAPVAVLSKAGVGQLWPGEQPGEAIGRSIRLTYGLPTPETRTVVGVVDDVRPHPGEAATPEMYLPITDAASRGDDRLTAIVRFARGAAPTAAGIDARLDRILGPGRLTMVVLSESMAPYLQRPRFQAVLFGVLAVIALALAAAGLFALATYDAAERVFEMGVRIALGATAGQIRAAVLSTAVEPVVFGAAVGLLGAWWAGRFLQSFLFEVDARDPGTLVLVVAILIATAILAAWLPARRAARTDPAEVLRAQ